jgi:hypothetical protein
VTVTASDVDDDSVSDDFTISVNDVNEVPDAGVLSAQVWTPGQTENYDASQAFNDVDSDTLTYSIEVKDSNGTLLDASGWLSINSVTGELTANPKVDQHGHWIVTVTASDGELEASSDLAVVVEKQFAGMVIDGPLADAFVFIDGDGDGVWDTGEDWTYTDASANFELFSTQQGNLVATTDAFTVDILSGVTVDGLTLKASGDASVITPLTTLLVEMEQQGISEAAAEATLKMATGLENIADLKSFNPLQDGTSLQQAQYLNAGVQIVSTLKALSAAVTASSTSGSDAESAVFAKGMELIAQQLLTPDTTSDLTDLATVKALGEGLANEFQVVVSDENLTEVSKAITNINSAVEKVSNYKEYNATPGDDNYQAWNLMALAQGTLAEQVKNLVGSQTSMTLAANDFDIKVVEAKALIDHLPTGIGLTGDGTIIHGANGVIVGDLVTTDLDFNENHNYLLTGEDAGLFELNGSQLKLKDEITTNFNEDPYYYLTITSTGQDDNLAITQDFFIEVDAPENTNNAESLSPFTFRSQVIKASETEFADLDPNEDIIKLTLNVSMAGINHSDLGQIQSITSAGLEVGINWNDFEVLQSDKKYQFNVNADPQNAMYNVETPNNVTQGFDKITLASLDLSGALSIVDSLAETSHVRDGFDLSTIYLNPVDSISSTDISLGGLVIAKNNNNPDFDYEFTQAESIKSIKTMNQIEAKVSVITDITDGATSTQLLHGFNMDFWAGYAPLGQSLDLSEGKIKVTDPIDFDAIKLSDPDIYNSELDIRDVMGVLKHIVQIETLDGTMAYQAADVDNNNKIDIRDVMAILKDIVDIKSIDTFDLVQTDQNGVVTRVDSLRDSNPENPPELILIANGDVNFDGSFATGYLL